MFTKKSSRLREMLAHNVSTLRRQRKLERGQLMSQAHLAQLAGVSIGTVQKVESGATWPDWKTMLKIAEVLEVHVDDLYLGGENLALPKALEIVNRELGIDLRPGKPTLQMNKDFFFKSLEKEAAEVRKTLPEEANEALNSLIAQTAESAG